MPKSRRVRRSKTLHEQFDNLLKACFPEIRERAQTLYYRAQQRTLDGMTPSEYATERTKLMVPLLGKAWKLGYDHGRFILLLKQLGFEEV